MRFGVCGLMTDRGVQPMDLARWVESHGFESLWLGEHTHTPVSIEGGQGRDASGFDELYDPYLSLAAAAAVTSSLRLGLAVALLPQHHPITLAKTIASLDRISGGRILLGIGAGSRKEEVEEVGYAFADRWKVVREHIRAMRAIWTQDIASFEGTFVRFGPMRCCPKPVQPADLRYWKAPSRSGRQAEYADGWIGWDWRAARDDCNHCAGDPFRMGQGGSGTFARSDDHRPSPPERT